MNILKSQTIQIGKPRIKNIDKDILYDDVNILKSLKSKEKENPKLGDKND